MNGLSVHSARELHYNPKTHKETHLQQQTYDVLCTARAAALTIRNPKFISLLQTELKMHRN